MRRPSIITGDYTCSSRFGGGSRLVLGTSSLGGVWADVNEQESVETILYALNEGVTVLDTAPSYRNAQEYIGKALKKWKGERPFISTKAGRLKADRADEVYTDYSVEGIRKSVLKSLDLLQVNYIDLLFLHEPHLVPLDKMGSILETLHGFKKEGIVGSIGIGGNPSGEFWEYVKKEHFEVVSTFLKLDACCLEALKKDMARYRKEDMAIYAASSLHMGLLGKRFNEYVEKPPRTKWITGEHIENAKKVNQIAESNGFTLTELSLRYLFSMGEADRVVLGPLNKREVQDSLSAWRKGVLSEEIFDEMTDVLLKPPGR